VAQAQAGGIIGAANARTQGMSGISNAFGGGIQNYMLMNALGGNTGYGGTGGSMPYAAEPSTAASPGTGQYGMESTSASLPGGYF
jgi:hypothetical protein